MKDILKSLQEHVVERSNSLRFNSSEMFDLVIKSDKFKKLEKIGFIKNIFGWNFATCKTVIDRMINDDISFMDITNELNSKGLLN